MTRQQRLAHAGLWLFLLSPVVVQPVLSLVNGRGPIDALYAYNVVTSILWVGVLFAVGRRPLYLHLALAPLYFTTAVDLFLISAFGNRISSGYVTISLTDHTEAKAFVEAYAAPVAAVVIVLLLVYASGLVGVRKLSRNRAPRLLLSCAVGLAVVYGAVIARGVRDGFGIKGAILDAMGKEMSAPMGAVFQSAEAVYLLGQDSELTRRRAAYAFGARNTLNFRDEVFVWVIGESSRPQNWSLFGYPRDTTPELRRMPSLIRFPNMLTTAPHTSVAVPSMLSLRSIRDWTSVLAQGSVVSVFKQAGFKTYWLSTQQVDSWAGIVPKVAEEANRTIYFDRAYDGVLLEELKKILQDTPHGERLFIVLHSLGSHWIYSRRYPQEFDRFKGLKGTDSGDTLDTYDNSILYTDWFLSNVIRAVRQRHAAAAVFYASDHGENLRDDARQLFGHAIGNRYDMPTASFVWISEMLRERAPAKMAAAKANSDAYLSLSNLPHSMLDIAGIEAKGFDPSMSIFSTKFLPHSRWYQLRGQLKHETEDLRNHIHESFSSVARRVNDDMKNAATAK